MSQCWRKPVELLALESFPSALSGDSAFLKMLVRSWCEWLSSSLHSDIFKVPGPHGECNVIQSSLPRNNSHSAQLAPFFLPVYVEHLTLHCFHVQPLWRPCFGLPRQILTPLQGAWLIFSYLQWQMMSHIEFWASEREEDLTQSRKMGQAEVARCELASIRGHSLHRCPPGSLRTYTLSLGATSHMNAQAKTCQKNQYWEVMRKWKTIEN